MTFVDSSAWVEFLRGTGSPVCEAVDRLLGGDLAISDPVLMEVLAGARDEHHLRDLRALLGRARMLRCGPPDRHSAAAAPALAVSSFAVSVSWYCWSISTSRSRFGNRKNTSTNPSTTATIPAV